MKKYLIFILIFNLTCVSAQTAFLDSIFFKISFENDLWETKQLLMSKKGFTFHSTDTVSTYGKYISYIAFQKNPIPNKSLKTKYTKGTIKILVDGKMPDNCLKYYSSIQFSYKNKTAAKKDFNDIAKYLDTKLKPKFVVGLVNLKGERYGYELHLSENKHCNYVTLIYGQDSDNHFVEIKYY